MKPFGTRRLALMLACALFCAGCNWSQWGGSAARSGTNPFETNLSRTRVPLLVPSTMTSTPPTGQVAATQDLVFVQRNGTLTALDARSYGVVWVGSLPAGSTAGSVPAIHEASKTVFVVVAGTTNPVLVGFDMNGVRNCRTLLNSCSPIFRAELGDTPGAATPPAVDGGRVFAAGANSLYAFDAAGGTNCSAAQGVRTCTPLWSAPTGASTSGVGPAVTTGVAYSPVSGGVLGLLGAFDAATGQLLWTGSLGPSSATATPSVANGKVFAPAGSEIAAFAGGGCGAATCSPSFVLEAGPGAPAGGFSATPSVDGSRVFATNGNGSLYAWPAAGCGSASCEPTDSTALNTPTGGSTTYAQAAAAVNGMLFISAQRDVSGVNHVIVLALDETNLDEVTSWDLGAGDSGPGLASVSVAWGIVYAPTDSALVALHPPAIEPLASLSVSPLSLTPAFSPSTFDYVLRCAAGTNSVTIDMSAVPGGSVQLIAPTTTQPAASQVVPVQLLENQAAVIRATNADGAYADYWIRCLPNDFPPLTLTRTGEGPTPGWYLVGNNLNLFGTPPRAFAMILDTNGTPVWYQRPTPAGPETVTPIARDTVAFMQTPRQNAGYSINPDGYFDVYNLDTGQQRHIQTVGVPTDFHELNTLPSGNHLLLSYALKGGVDLTGLAGNPTPGPNSTIADCIVQEVDPQGNLVWEWRGSEHLDPRTETAQSPVDSATVNGTPVYDVFHCNSIDQHPNGNLLVSARHLNAIFEINRSDGKVLWKMGGTPTNKDGAEIITILDDPYGGIVQQHDARYLPNGNISLFDNQRPQNGHPARAIEYAVDFTTNTAHPVFSFAAPGSGENCCMGSFRRYSDGHSLIGWGFLVPYGGLAATELDAAGNAVFSLTFHAGAATYRAVKVPTTRFDINDLRRTAGR
jgi:Arylsulfotransferase (ASST)/PQQ-like domain